MLSSRAECKAEGPQQSVAPWNHQIPSAEQHTSFVAIFLELATIPRIRGTLQTTAMGACAQERALSNF